MPQTTVFTDVSTMDGCPELLAVRPATLQTLVALAQSQ